MTAPKKMHQRFLMALSERHDRVLPLSQVTIKDDDNGCDAALS